MRSILFSVLLCCFVLTKSTKPRSVNVALETSLLFEPGEEHNSFIDKMRHFIDQIEKAITPVKPFLRTTTENDKIFTEFLGKTVTAVLKYDNKDLKEAIKLLIDELEILFDSTNIFSEDTEERILDILINHSEMKPNKVRLNLPNVLNSNDSSLYVSIVKLNQYFNDSDKTKLDDVLKKFASEKDNFKDIFTSFMHLIKDKYENLSNIDRKKFGNIVNKIFNNIDIKLVSSENTNGRKDKTIENNRGNSTASNLNKLDGIFINKDVEVSVRSPKDEENYSKGKDVKFNKPNSVELSAVEDNFNGS